MTDKQQELIDLYIQKVINDNSHLFADILLHGTDIDMDRDQIYAKMIQNSVTLSVNIAAKIIIDLLEEKDILSLVSDEKILQKSVFKLRTEFIDS